MVSRDVNLALNFALNRGKKKTHFSIWAQVIKKAL